MIFAGAFDISSMTITLGITAKLVKMVDSKLVTLCLGHFNHSFEMSEAGPF